MHDNNYSHVSFSLKGFLAAKCMHVWALDLQWWKVYFLLHPIYS